MEPLFKKNRLSGISALLLFSCVSYSLRSYAALNLAQQPLFLSNGSTPNVVFMLDDSGSMDWEILTSQHFDYCNYESPQWWCDNTTRNGGVLHRAWYSYYYLYDNDNNAYSNKSIEDEFLLTDFDDYFGGSDQTDSYDWRVFSPLFNKLYFDSGRTYHPWQDYLPDAVFSSARAHPISGEDGYSEIRDLTGSFYVEATDSAGSSSTVPTSTSYISGANGQIDGWDDYLLYQIDKNQILRWSVTYTNSGGSASRTVTALSSITDATAVATIQQNFANWYQYHRRRSFVVNAAVSNLVETSPNYRYALGTINEDSMLVGTPTSKDFDAHNDSILQSLFAKNQERNGTPLRRGLERVGTFLQGTGSSAPITESCQQNFSILFSDGYWNGGAPLLSIGDQDFDGYVETLADVAYYFYQNDLRPDLNDDVPTSTVDPLSIQHLSTFTVAFGVQGNLSDTDGNGWPEISGAEPDTDSDWGNPLNPNNSDNLAKIDDLWHAAFNSKGLYTQANTTSEIAAGLSSALAEVDRRVGSAAAITTNSVGLNNGRFLYQARFNSQNWTGDVLSYSVASDGSIDETTAWAASDYLNSDSFNYSSRVVIAGDNGTGKPFRYSDLSATYQGLLTASMGALGASGSAATFGAELVDYLRGKSASDITAYDFRQRSSRLGDLIHSTPSYVGAPSQSMAPYNDTAYTNFRNAYSSRQAMIYVGGNDGMLHGLNAINGEEALAFVPSNLAGDLYQLADPDYSHRYYVDGPITVTDACIGSSPSVCNWTSVLVAGLRSGGRGIYALDVTNPSNFLESKANDIFLWELTDTNDDVGYIYGAPSIVKLQTGDWGVVIGNGYNSTNGLAKLIIVNATTGAVIKTIETNNSLTDNGLSSPAVVDVNRDGVADAVYAGDLQGNLWKFDISDTDASKWDVAFSSGGSRSPLYAGGVNKPITSEPQVGYHPAASGYLVYFGTGKYLEVNDNVSTGQETQGYHAVWDNGSSTSTPITDSDLLAQTIDFELTIYSKDTNGDDVISSDSDEALSFRLTSRNSIDWSVHKGWRLDLSLNGNNRGERQVTDSILRNNRIIFTTTQPSSSQCENGGQSWLMEVSALNGASLMESVFDVNGDGVFDAEDRDFENWTYEDLSSVCGNGGCPAASGFLINGIVTQPTIVSGSEGMETKYISNSDGSLESVDENPGNSTLGRQSWNEIVNQ